MKNLLIFCLFGALITLGFVFAFRESETKSEVVRAGFPSAGTSQIYFETQYRRGREYGVWYAKDGSGNITTMQVLPLDR